MSRRYYVDPCTDEKLFPLRMRVVKPFKTHFMGIVFKAGTVVMACRDSRTRYSVRKLKLPRPALALNSVCCNVSAACLQKL